MLTTLSRSRRLLAILSTLLATIGAVNISPAKAAGTNPALVISSVTTSTATNGSRLVSVSGQFNVDDFLQFTFPLGIIVTQGSSFARYDFNRTTTAGSSVLVADGVQAADVTTLLSGGAPASPPTAITTLRQGEVQVILPSNFTPGAASVIVYTILEGGAFVSNSVTITLQ